MEHKLRMMDLPASERPIEKIIASGADQLSNQELLAAVIGIGSKKASALDLAAKILSENGGIRALATADVHTFKRITGIGPTKAAKLLAVIEIGKRIHDLDRDTKAKFNSPLAVYDYFKSQLRFEKIEKFCTATVNTKNELLSTRTISVGTINASLVHPREVFSYAVKEQAHGIVLIHNHPSGNPEPSTEDRLLTKRLCEAGKLIGIHVLDHIIIGDNRYYSFKENDLIQ